MRNKLERFIPLVLLSSLFFAQQAQPTLALTFADSMNRVLLGLLGLESSAFATEAGSGAWIFVFCGFLIVFGVIFAVTHYLPFFKEESNRMPRMAFSVGLGIASLLYPGYLDMLWYSGAVTFAMVIVVILGLIYFIARGMISGHHAAGVTDAKTIAEIAQQRAAEAEAQRRGTEATQGGRRITAETDTAVAQQTTEQNLQPNRLTREQRRLALETDQQLQQVNQLTNRVTQELAQLQGENTRRTNQINDDAARQGLGQQEIQNRINQEQARFTQLSQEIQARAQRDADEFLARQAREQNWDAQRLQAEQVRVNAEIQRLAQEQLARQAQTQTEILRQQQAQAQVQRALNAEQAVLSTETQYYNQLLTHVRDSLNQTATIVQRLQQVREALRLAGGIMTDNLRTTALREIGPLAGMAANLQTFIGTEATVMQSLNQLDTEIQNSRNSRRQNGRAPLARQTTQINDLQTTAQRIRTQANTTTGAMTASSQNFLNQLNQLIAAVDAGNAQSASQLIGPLESEAIALNRRFTELQGQLTQANHAITQAQTLITSIQSTP